MSDEEAKRFASALAEAHYRALCAPPVETKPPPGWDPDGELPDLIRYGILPTLRTRACTGSSD